MTRSLLLVLLLCAAAAVIACQSPAPSDGGSSSGNPAAMAGAMATAGTGGAMPAAGAVAGTAGTPDAAGSCAAGLTLCNGTCVSVMESTANCGGCGMACAAGQACVNGVCSCNTGQTDCGGVCVDTSADVNNCGGCGMACGSTQGCSAGLCACPTTAALCGDACVDTTVDVNNCGDCDIACVTGQDCAAGACTCQGGLLDCAGACVDQASDPDNCGACGTVCAAEQVCSLSACAAQCDASLTQCDRSCVDTNTSPFHCGECDNACGAGLSCVDGVCNCAEGQTLCGGQCVDTLTNLSHCGACDSPCGGGSTCEAGMCSCPEGQDLCDGQCVDVLTDELNCGACGNLCLAGECTNGACPGVKDCASKTVVTSLMMTDFEDYDPTTPPEEYNFTFNTGDDTDGPVLAGTYHYHDETGVQTPEMVAGNNSSNYAFGITNTEASDWGGGMGLWMMCIDATAFDGLSFWVQGSVPGGQMSLNLAMEQTNPPSEDDPATGGTCEADTCEAAWIDFPVTTTWSRVLLPWSQFTPGQAGDLEVPATGSNITGFSLNVQLEWVQMDPDDPESFGAQPSAYNVAIDDIGFYNEADVCDPGTTVCGGSCVDQQTNNDHCGECGNACTGGATCNAGTCECPGGQTFCVDSCVDTQTEQYHCGGCGNVCALTATCSGGQCQGGNSSTSNTCGSTMQLLGNPFGCEFAWGANDDAAIPSYVNFGTKWVGYEQNPSSQCDGCGFLTSMPGGVVPLYIAYFIAYHANSEAGLGDCNTDNDGNNLCTGGAQWVRDNRSKILSMYTGYAQQSYNAYSNNPVIWLVEPDLSQYAEPSQSNPMSYSELGSLTTDIVCAIKSAMPNSVIALTHSSWLAEPEYSQFWSAMPLDLADLVHVTGRGDTGEYINDSDSYMRSDGTWDYLHSLTGKPIIADTSFGVTTMQDTWASNDASTLNARIADGVAGALVYPIPGDYQSKINSLGSQLNSTCQ